MRNIVLIISYNGAKFYGWQKQKGVPTIQETIENAIEKVTNEKGNLIGASRTDKGVHAIMQIANFFTTSNIPVESIHYAISQYLPKSIVIKKAFEVNHNFNSRFSAKRKTYLYIVDNSKFFNPILQGMAFFFPYNMDYNEINESAKIFLGTKDFKALSNVSNVEIKNTVRTIYDIKIEKKGSFIIFYITADGFLYRMARNIVGTLLDIGRHKRTKEEVEKGLFKKDRNLLGFCAPPHALYLYSIEY